MIGLTGCTASGKSSIAKRLEALGAYTVDCDKVSEAVLLIDQQVMLEHDIW